MRVRHMQSRGGIHKPIIFSLTECTFGDQSVPLGGDLLRVAAYVGDADVWC